jgi:hypothetical protein
VNDRNQAFFANCPAKLRRPDADSGNSLPLSALPNLAAPSVIASALLFSSAGSEDHTR